MGQTVISHWEFFYSIEVKGTVGRVRASQSDHKSLTRRDEEDFALQISSCLGGGGGRWCMYVLRGQGVSYWVVLCACDVSTLAEGFFSLFSILELCCEEVEGSLILKRGYN